MAYKGERYYFQRTAQLAREALSRGDDGFACLLTDQEGTILLGQGNEAQTRRDPTAHDVLLLVQKAVSMYDSDFLSKCTVYALTEPCVMCMGAVFWSKIGTVKYAFSEEELNQILPGGLEIHSREFAERSPRKILVFGSDPETAEQVGAEEIVKDWVRSLGIPGLPKED